MISAADARVLYDDSGAEVASYLTATIEPAIKKAATSGLRKCFIDFGCKETYCSIPNPSPTQARAISELKGLGYIITTGIDGAPYVPRGLADDSGEGPKYHNYGIFIGW